MKRIARFEKVSFGQFSDGWDDTFQAIEKGENKDQSKETLKEIYDRIKLPRRATAGSAGYDFFAPVDIILNPGETIKIPTGIRVWMEPEWVLKCYPRSGLGFKFRLQLNNTVGIIDSDYYNSDNEGHIFAKLTNDSNEEKTVQIKAGEGFMQGIFVEYGITVDDAATDVRNGGFGSTTKSNTALTFSAENKSGSGGCFFSLQKCKSLPVKRKLKGWKKADRFYILNMQRGNAFTKEEDTFQMKIIKRLLSFIFLCVIIAGGVLGYKGYEEYKKALSEESVKEMAARIEEQPNYTTIDELPQTYIDAVLSVEDKRFYDHFGVDPIAVGRAFFNDIKAGAYVEGGSTITQQLAKNQYFTQDKKIVRKVAEMFMAFKIESELDKDTIFELYVNSIFFGNGYYCVADASNGYFGKVPSEMNFDECTLLAGVPNAPTNYNPTASPELARQRQKQVIEKMKKAGYLEESVD